jgi:hypothetical protein
LDFFSIFNEYLGEICCPMQKYEKH